MGAREIPRPGRLTRRQLVRRSGLVAAGTAGAALVPSTVADAIAAAPADRSLAQLGRELDGQLLRPGDAEFLPTALQTAWRYAVSPAAIAVCASTEDVVRSVRYVRETGTQFAVRGGGHSYEGSSTTSGLLISTRGLRQVVVDPSA